MVYVPYNVKEISFVRPLSFMITRPIRVELMFSVTSQRICIAHAHIRVPFHVEVNYGDCFGSRRSEFAR